MSLGTLINSQTVAQAQPFADKRSQWIVELQAALESDTVHLPIRAASQEAVMSREQMRTIAQGLLYYYKELNERFEAEKAAGTVSPSYGRLSRHNPYHYWEFAEG